MKPVYQVTEQASILLDKQLFHTAATVVQWLGYLLDAAVVMGLVPIEQAVKLI